MELDDVAHLWWSNSHAELTEISSRATVFYNSRWGLAFLCDVTEKRPPTLTLLVFQSLPPGEVRHSVFWLWQRLPNQRLFQDLASPSLKTCFSFLQLSQWSLTTFSSETLRCLLHQATFSPEELCTADLPESSCTKTAFTSENFLYTTPQATSLPSDFYTRNLNTRQMVYAK